MQDFKKIGGSLLSWLSTLLEGTISNELLQHAKKWKWWVPNIKAGKYWNTLTKIKFIFSRYNQGTF